MSDIGAGETGDGLRAVSPVDDVRESGVRGQPRLAGGQGESERLTGNARYGTRDAGDRLQYVDASLGSRNRGVGNITGGNGLDSGCFQRRIERVDAGIGANESVIRGQ